MTPLFTRPVQAVYQYGLSAVQKNIKCVKIAATAASSTIAIKKLSKLMLETAKIVEILAGECFLSHYRPIINSFKGCKQLIGACDILGSLRYWLKPSKSSNHLLLQKPSLAKRVAELFKSVVSAFKTLKYLDIVEVSRLGAFAFKLGAVSIFGRSLELPNVDLGSLKKAVKYGARISEGILGSKQVARREAKQALVRDEVAVWTKSLEDLEAIIAAAAEEKATQGDPKIKEYQSRLVGFHTQQIYAHAQTFFHSSFPEQFQRKTAANQPIPAKFEEIDDRIAEVVRQLGPSSATTSSIAETKPPIEDTTSQTSQSKQPAIIEFGHLVDGIVKGISQAMQGTTIDIERYKNLARQAVLGLRSYEQQPLQTNSKRTGEASKVQAIHELLEWNLELQETLSKEAPSLQDLQSIKEKYKSQLGKLKQKQLLYPLKESIENAVMFESFFGLSKTSLGALLWLTGAGGAFVVLPMLGITAAGIGLWRSYQEQELEKLKAKKTKANELEASTPV